MVTCGKESSEGTADTFRAEQGRAAGGVRASGGDVGPAEGMVRGCSWEDICAPLGEEKRGDFRSAGWSGGGEVETWWVQEPATRLPRGVNAGKSLGFVQPCGVSVFSSAKWGCNISILVGLVVRIGGHKNMRDGGLPRKAACNHKEPGAHGREGPVSESGAGCRGTFKNFPPAASVVLLSPPTPAPALGLSTLLTPEALPLSLHHQRPGASFCPFHR